MKRIRTRTHKWCTLLTTNTDRRVSDTRYDLHIYYELLHWCNRLQGILPVPRTRTCCLYAGDHRSGSLHYRCMPSRSRRCRNILFCWFCLYFCQCTSLPSLSTCRKLYAKCVGVCAVLASGTCLSFFFSFSGRNVYGYKSNCSKVQFVLMITCCETFAIQM